MAKAIYVHHEFEQVWPLVADRLRERWPDAVFEGLAQDDERPLHAVVDDPESITHLISLGVPVSPESPAAFPALSEAAIFTSGYGLDDAVADAFQETGVTLHTHESEGFWGQSVAECALRLAIDGLRRIRAT